MHNLPSNDSENDDIKITRDYVQNDEGPPTPDLKPQFATKLTDQDLEEQPLDPKLNNLTLFKQKVQDEIKRNVQYGEDHFFNSSPIYQSETIIVPSQDSMKLKQSGKNDDLKNLSHNEETKQTPTRYNDNDEFDDISENVSEDSSLQEYILKDHHEIKHIDFRHFSSPSNDKYKYYDNDSKVVNGKDSI